MPTFGSRKVHKVNKTIKSTKYHKEMLNQVKQPTPNKYELKQIYMCSCGKQYQSFAATYLHFREKHDIKLSTKPNQKRKTIEIEGNLKKITYVIEIQNSQASIYSQNNKNNDALSSQKKISLLSPQVKNIQNCISKYLSQSNKKSKQILQNLIQFLAEQSQDNKRLIELKIQKLPLFLNDFSLKYLPVCRNPVQVGSYQWKYICQQLKKFCDWLRTQNYTQLIVFYEKL